jgi:hypothetical protein
MATSTIYVGLIDENVEVWRPVEAEPLGDDVFRILSENTDPETEVWEFITGELVVCEPRRFSGGSSGSVAARKVERHGLRQPFLACYDYGQGGIWVFIVAESAREITDAYPELSIAERTPDWVTPDAMQRIPRLDLNQLSADPLGGGGRA